MFKWFRRNKPKNKPREDGTVIKFRMNGNMLESHIYIASDNAEELAKMIFNILLGGWIDDMAMNIIDSGKQKFALDVMSMVSFLMEQAKEDKENEPIISPDRVFSNVDSEPTN